MTDQCFGLSKSWLSNENFQRNQEEKEENKMSLHSDLLCQGGCGFYGKKKYYRIPKFHKMNKKKLNQADICRYFFSLSTKYAAHENCINTHT